MLDINLLNGKHVMLRALEPEDLEILYTLENDTTLWDISSVNVPYSRYVLKQFIAKGSHDIYSDGQLRLMVESIEDGTTIGMVDLVSFNPQHARCEVGIVLAKDYRNKGYGTEVLFLLEQYVRDFLHLNQLYAYVSEKNIPSIHLFQNAGFKITGKLEKWLYFKQEWVDTFIFQKVF